MAKTQRISARPLIVSARTQQIAAGLLALAAICWINFPVPSDHELWAVESLIEPKAWSRDVYRELLSSGGYLRLHGALAYTLGALGCRDYAQAGLLIAELSGLLVFFAALFRLALTMSGGRLTVAWAAIALLTAEAVVWPVGEGRILPVGMRHGITMAFLLFGWNAYLEGLRGESLAWLVGACALHGNPSLAAFGAWALVDGWTTWRMGSAWKKPLVLWAAAGVGVLALYIGTLTQPDTLDPRFAEAALRAIEGHISIFTAGRLQMGFSLLGLVFAGIIFLGIRRLKIWDERRDAINLRLIAIILAVTLLGSLYWDFVYRYVPWTMIPRLQAVKVGRLMDIIVVISFCRLVDKFWTLRAWPWCVGLLILTFSTGVTTDFFLRAAADGLALGLVYSEKRWAKIGLWLSSVVLVLLPLARPALEAMADRVSLAGAFLDKPAFDPWVAAVFTLLAGAWFFWGRSVRTPVLTASTAAAVLLSALMLKYRGHFPPPAPASLDGITEACRWISARTPPDSLVFIPPTLHPSIFYEEASRPIFLSKVNLDASNYYGRRADAVYRRWEELGFNFNDRATQERLFAQIGNIEERLTPELFNVLGKKYGIDYLLWPNGGKKWPYPVVYKNAEYALYRADWGP